MEVAGAPVVNENIELDDAPVDDPNMGELVEVTEPADDPKMGEMVADATETVDDPNIGELVVEATEPVDDPNISELAVEAIAPVDAPKVKLEDDEPNEEPNGDLLGCQPECPNILELVPLLELAALAAEDETEVLSPKVVPELKTLAVELEGNIGPPGVKALFPLDPNNGDEADDPNGVDWL